MTSNILSKNYFEQFNLNTVDAIVVRSKEFFGLMQVKFLVNF